MLFGQVLLHTEETLVGNEWEPNAYKPGKQLLWVWKKAILFSISSDEVIQMHVRIWNRGIARHGKKKSIW